MQLEHRLPAQIQLHLHSQLNTWLRWIRQRQLEGERRIMLVLWFGAPYIRDFTVFLLLLQVLHILYIHKDGFIHLNFSIKYILIVDEMATIFATCSKTNNLRRKYLSHPNQVCYLQQRTKCCYCKHCYFSLFVLSFVNNVMDHVWADFHKIPRTQRIIGMSFYVRLAEPRIEISCLVPS